MADPGTPDRYLAGRVALVTGATRGVGRATAARLHAAGAYVYLNYAHDDAQAAATLAALDAVGGPGGAGLARGDVTAPDTLPAVLERIGAERGRLDVFVHNVSSLHPMQATAPDPHGVHADLATALDPLLYGIGGLTKLLPPDGGRIVAVSSLGGRAVIPRYVSLGVAKAALESLVRYLAVELAGRGVTVNAVAGAKLDKGEPLAPHEQALADRAPAGRLATPDDLADVV
ncbi:MAG TPA: SDR family oxidoreductase, partial [Rugosimonospora sp.]|nr:SDR family oxidoreductase [Rugosimonospora sp.]